MRLVTFTKDGNTRIGALKGDAIVDFSAVAPGLPTDMLSLLQAGPDAMKKAKDIAETEQGTIAVSDVTLESPIQNPPKILAVGMNYMDHFNEVKDVFKLELPKTPVIFNKQTSSVNRPYGDAYLPSESEQMDYEGELAIVIGQRCRRVSKENAMDVVAGFTICNDFTIRDWQMQAPTMTMGKSWDSHCPLGPTLVTPDEVDHANLNFKTFVNGEERQNSNTDQLIFDCPTIIEYLSTAFTLEPGDVIATGTSSGVIMFMPGQPWLKEGDVVRVEFDGLGHIENKVVKDPIGSFAG